MNNSSSLICTLALGCLQACAGHAIDLDQGASSAPSGTDLVGVEVTRVSDSISELGADDARVYWTSAKYPSEGPYVLYSIAQSCVFDQCNATRVSYGDIEPPLTIGEQDVFFTPVDRASEGRFGRLVDCPKAGCEAAPSEIFEDTEQHESAAVDDRYFYWSSELDIYRCPLTGCKGEVPEVVAKDETTNSELIVDGDTLFWTVSADASDPNAESQIHSAPKDGSRPPTLIANGVSFSLSDFAPRAFAVDATTVYWLDGSAHVQSCPRTGCNGQAPVTLVATDGAKQSLRVDATGLYWLETAGLGFSSDPPDAGVDLSVRFCSLTGCANEADVHVLTPSTVGQFAMSSKYLYWDEPWVLENSAYAYTDNRQIFRLAKPE
jgi:hypothetical protein